MGVSGGPGCCECSVLHALFHHMCHLLPAAKLLRNQPANVKLYTPGHGAGSLALHVFLLLSWGTVGLVC